MQVAKWGNSLAVRIPAALAAELGLRPGDEIEVVGRRAESDAPPTLEGEGISYGAESITGIDFNVTCTGSGADLTLSALGNDAEGNNYVVSYGGGEFSYVSSASDMVSNALSLTAGPSAAGTDVTVEAGDGSHTFTGNGALATVDQPMPETVPFVANLTCDTTI